MKNVSRSFALVTPNVETPLNHYLSTAYLICRVVDNIEDCTQPFPWQQARFAEFAQLLDEPERATAVLQQWQQEEWPGLIDDEKEMMGMANGLPLWEIYAQIPAASREPIRVWAKTMAEGMERVENPAGSGLFIDRDGVKITVDEAAYDQYCFYVAGTVGHMATELTVLHYDINGRAAGDLLENSEICGRALQKTNIIKDFAKDLGRGVSYLPDSWMQQVDYAPLRLEGAPSEWTFAVIENALQELDNSVPYVLGLPAAATGYRRASLLTMLPAYQTLLLAAKKQKSLFTSKHHVKISRPTMVRCLFDAKRLANNDEAIIAYAQNMHQKIMDECQKSPAAVR